MRDLADLRLLVQRASDAWTVLNAGAMALHEAELEKACAEAQEKTKRQIDWLETSLKMAAPQALVAKAHRAEEIKSSLPKLPLPAALQDGIWVPLAIAALALATGLIGMAFGQAWLWPSLAAHVLTGHRLAASALGLGLMTIFQASTRSWHAPAAATVLLVTLGSLAA